MSGVDPRVAASFADQGLMTGYGARLVEVSSGRCVIEVDHAPHLTQQNGFFHAGVTTALCDTASGYAAFTTMAEGSNVLSVEFKINLMAPADGQRLRAVAEVVRAGRTLVVVRATALVVKDGRETACAEFLGTMMAMVPR